MKKFKYYKLWNLPNKKENFAKESVSSNCKVCLLFFHLKLMNLQVILLQIFSITLGLQQHVEAGLKVLGSLNFLYTAGFLYFVTHYVM